MKHFDCVIIGGGVTGLAAAHRLKTLRPGASFLLLEASSRLGGKVVTESENGFIIEGSADSFLSRKPEAFALAKELGLLDRLQSPKPENKRSWVLRNGRLHKIPEGLSGLIPANLDALTNNTLLSPEAIARIQAEPDIPPADPDADESVAEFITRRLGREAFENLIEPLMSGIFGGRADLLSLNATFPQLRQIEQQHGSLLRGLGKKNTGKAPAPAGDLPPFLSFKDGMGELITALETRIGGENIRREAPVESVEASDGGYLIHCKIANGASKRGFAAQTVLFAAPAFAAAKILKPLNAKLCRALTDIPYGSSTIVTLAYDETLLPRKLNGYGYIIPRIEGKNILASTWSSKKWLNRAPQGKVLLRVFFGRFGDTADDAAVSGLAQDELRETLEIDAEPEFVRIRRWPLSMPQYTLGHLERIRTIETLASAHPGLALAGAWFRGVGIPDCIREGRDAAEKLNLVFSN